MASGEEQSEGSGASLLKKEWPQVRDLIREERGPFVRSANRLMLPCVWSEGRQLPLRSVCGLRRRISGPVWSSSSGELKGSQVLPEGNLLLVSGLLEGLRGDYQLGEPLEAVSYQRGFSLRDRP